MALLSLTPCSCFGERPRQPLSNQPVYPSAMVGKHTKRMNARFLRRDDSPSKAVSNQTEEQAATLESAVKGTSNTEVSRANDSRDRVAPCEANLDVELCGPEDAAKIDMPQSQAKRQAHMNLFLHSGLEKTAKLAALEKKAADAIHIVLSVKGALNSALTAVRIAAIAWTGIFVNP
ncbi:hypothetical protein BD289DRAFT_452112 [Coniella lustricola]|uniref:NWD NACHT-NTPase N-terminal domain-containing protein n=1 Tax=Coniella lustricola TaxID=2025994 RepID=A0A2T3AC96_9PEZI|nr:hypothetical protein BD289DRAFT_452112 [Coniella lustricola]